MNDLILLISGTRKLDPEKYPHLAAKVGAAIDNEIEKRGSTRPLVIHGEADGVDNVSDRHCKKNDIELYTIPYLKRFFQFGGHARNFAMAQYALGMVRQMSLIRYPDPPLVLLAFPEASKKQSGTWDMIRTCKRLGIPREIEEFDFSGQEVLF